jgi:hypothetical protein
VPWTPRQARYLLSKGSPLTAAQRKKMDSELKANPALARKGGTSLQSMMKERR